MKKKRINTYDLILANELGSTTTSRKRTGSSRSNMVLSKSLDDGEVLVQKQPQSAEEYVVGQSATTTQFQEYVVGQSAEEIAFEEYVVGMSVDTASEEEYVVTAQSSSLSASFSAPQEIEVSSRHLSADDDMTIQQELGTDLFQAAGNSRPQQPIGAQQPGKQQSRKPAPQEPPLDFAEAYTAQDTKPVADEDDFINDMKAILSGEKTFDPQTKKAVDKQNVSAPRPQQHGRSNPNPDANDGHAIFKKIAENMQYANAYDLGTVELENRFTDFDRIEDIRRTPKPTPSQPASNTKPTTPPPATAQELQVDHADFIRDLDAITAERKQPFAETKTGETATIPDTSTAAWPPRPTTIRPYTSAEKIAAFGQFTYEADPSTFGGDGIRVTNNWTQDNIINVSIPQLNGKRMGRSTITNGSIQFHKDGADRLRAVWAAWEQAGLLDRILTFEGGYAARFIRGTQARSPRPLSNHAWGTAFDINAPWNGFGAEPALMGREGCVRELVSIANSHGFFWGGHFSGSKDGMHFELGKTI